jgi:ankyrin repeat protein
VKDGHRALRALIDQIAAGAIDQALRALKAAPELARLSLDEGATHADPLSHFLTAIGHYVYAGDTALHVASAAHQPAMARALLDAGASVAAANRRGAQPLHYAMDAARGLEPRRVRSTVKLLVDAGADLDAATKEGTTPLHRAVRNRCAAAVAILLEEGVDWRRQNERGSTAFHLAVQTTGASGSGSEAAREQQREIIRLLLERGARLTDRDARGKTVRESITSEWVRELLEPPVRRGRARRSPG